MDGNKAGGEKAVQPAGSSGAATSSARAARQITSCPGDAAAAAPAGHQESHGGGGGDEEEEEQVDRFYALVADIRALRGGAGMAGGDGADARKRPRRAEPPWRPAFRLEDFEEPSPSSSSDPARWANDRKQGQEAGADGEESRGARPVPVASPSSSSSPPPRCAGARLDGSCKSI